MSFRSYLYSVSPPLPLSPTHADPRTGGGGGGWGGVGGASRTPTVLMYVCGKLFST